jgi:hypothetical protein
MEDKPGSKTTSLVDTLDNPDSRSRQHFRLRQVIISLKPEIIDMLDNGYFIRDVFDIMHNDGRLLNFNIKQFYYYVQKYIHPSNERPTPGRIRDPAKPAQEVKATENEVEKVTKKSPEVISDKMVRFKTAISKAANPGMINVPKRVQDVDIYGENS